MSTSTPPGGPEPPGDRYEIELHLGHKHLPARKTDISSGTAGAVTASRGILAGDACELLGWSIVEDAGVAAAAEIRLHDGKDANGEVLAVIKLPASGSSQVPPTNPGIEVKTGRIFLEWVAGSVEGVIYWK